MKKETKGEAKASPKGDTTQALRIYRRRARLNQIAWQAGYSNWSAYETAVLNGKTRLTPHALDGGESAPKKAESTPEVLSTSQALPKPTRRK